MARALLSVSDKSGLVPFARRLAALGWELVSSGGTGKELQAHGLNVTPVEQVTGNPEAFGGRMKTISFQLEGGILFDRSNPSHVEQATHLGVVPVDMVVCNFYPFSSGVEADRPLTDLVELIDVGGPTMVRAAAKNFHCVVVVTDPADYEAVASALERGGVGAEERRRLAVKAFRTMASYDLLISRALAPEAALRYGENPHQKGWFLDWPGGDELGLGALRPQWERPLSYNNYLDLEGAIGALCHLDTSRPAAVIVKHMNPCGAAVAATLEDAFERAWAGDPLAAFGGIVAVNRPVTLALARRILEEKRFVEVLCTPGVESDAAALLESRKSLKLVLHDGLTNARPARGVEWRSVRGGVLVQQVDTRTLSASHLEIVTEARPTEAQMRDLLMAWHVCKNTRSNSITLVHDEMLVGSGAGQQDRVRCCRLAVDKAGARARGAVAASDGFFPFPDGPETLIQAGIAAIVQPGGSVRDAESIAACNQAGIPMAMTGVRCFRH